MRRGVALAFLVLACACSNGRPDLSPDHEAFIVGESILTKCFTQCGDTWIGRKDVNGEVSYLQLKDAAFGAVALRDGKLTETDKRNGVEWRGITVVTAKSHRYYVRGMWTVWLDRPIYDDWLSLSLKKVSGKWQYDRLVYQPVPCDEIPPS
jgi:hypothetical protein